MRSPLVSGMVACSFLLLVACSGAHAGESLFGGDSDSTDGGTSSSSRSTSEEAGSVQLPKLADGGKQSSGGSSTPDPDTNQCEGTIGNSSCNKCVEKSCCDEAIACASVVQCTTLIQCGEACGANPQCLQQCAATNAGGVAPLQSLVACMSKQCAKKCN